MSLQLLYPLELQFKMERDASDSLIVCDLKVDSQRGGKSKLSQETLNARTQTR